MLNSIDGNAPISHSNKIDEVNESGEFNEINNGINGVENTTEECKAIFNKIKSEEINKVLISKIKELKIEKNIQGKLTTRVNNKNLIFPNKPNENETQSVINDLAQIGRAITDNSDFFTKPINNHDDNKLLARKVLSDYNNFTSLAPEFHNKSAKAMTDFSILLELQNADEAIIFHILENNDKNSSSYDVKQYLRQKYKGYIEARENKLNITNRAKNILKTMESNKFDKKIEDLFELVNDFKNKNIVKKESDLNIHDIFQNVAENYINYAEIHIGLEEAESIFKQMIKDTGLTFAASLNPEQRLEQVNLAINKTLNDKKKTQINRNDIIRLAMGKVKSVNRSNVFIRGMKGIRNLVIGKDNSKVDKLNKLTAGLINSFESNTVRILADNIKIMEKINEVAPALVKKMEQENKIKNETEIATKIADETEIADGTETADMDDKNMSSDENKVNNED